MSDLTPRYLLDKNVIRHLINGLRLPKRMGAEEQLALAIWVRLRQSGSLLCMSVETSHILQRLPSYREIAVVDKTVPTLEAGRYFKRWAHRLREHGFTREDAKVLSLGTFGTDTTGAILGVGTVVTFDRPLINNFSAARVGAGEPSGRYGSQSTATSRQRSACQGLPPG